LVQSHAARLREKSDLSRRIKVICPVQSRVQK